MNTEILIHYIINISTLIGAGVGFYLLFRVRSSVSNSFSKYQATRRTAV